MVCILCHFKTLSYFIPNLVNMDGYYSFFTIRYWIVIVDFAKMVYCPFL